ncbi:TetR/AcrR family transcriptional regulator [Sinorhizobium mexicanum]|uniref:TetR/AcrR family transcriptional regulator n=1 Tax=Sinorhizobium mexicanum TaxID=375549 RepID=A0A859QT62_9HYPH|nr:TetR/AcrR family transcriptional regulator [Sinorhizobium mexicanum]MBP1886049.1 AcrR family transcriptional regulator [Sinorhizobium mexicanum]QLL65327.1 TetR/AcrR family transcriptional regulator [Sinorhizobium mexicanum]
MNSKTQARGYHHGDLRSALIEAGLVLLEREGPAGVSLRAVARQAGVSQAAPYAHFAGKRELMSAIAAVGFSRLRDMIAPLASDPASGIGDLGVAYIDFAKANPGLYTLMFGSREHIDSGDVHLSLASRQAFELLAVKAGRKGPNAFDDPGPIAAWSLVHGLVTLLMNEKIPAEMNERLPEILRLLEPGIAEHTRE